MSSLLWPLLPLSPAGRKLGKVRLYYQNFIKYNIYYKLRCALEWVRMRNSSSLSPGQMSVLEYLKKAGACSAKRIASSLSVTTMGVRHHLMVLEKAGFVTTTVQRQRTGRPSFIYYPTESAGQFFPNEYADFANRLLRAIVCLDGERKLPQIFVQMAKSAVAQNASRMTGKGLKERTGEMAKIQSESGYMADWQQLTRNSFQLTEHHCAISEIVRNCPHACDCELTVIQDLLGATVTRKEHIANGDLFCRYVIQAVPKLVDNSRGRQRRLGPKMSRKNPVRS